MKALWGRALRLRFLFLRPNMMPIVKVDVRRETIAIEASCDIQIEKKSLKMGLFWLRITSFKAQGAVQTRLKAISGKDNTGKLPILRCPVSREFAEPT